MEQSNFPNFFQALFYARIVNFVFSIVLSFLIAFFYIVTGTYNSFYDDFSPKYQYFGTLLLLPGLFILLKKSHLKVFERTKFKFDVYSIFCVILIECIRVYLIISYGALFILPDNNIHFFDGMSTYEILGSLFVAPIIEEVLFRKIILTQFLKQYSLLASLLLSAFLFSLHWQLTSQPLLFFSYFFSGIIYGLIYYKTKSVIYPIMAHSFHNLLLGFPFFKIISDESKICFINFLTTPFNFMVILLLLSVFGVILYKWKPVEIET